jgi:hypothetical protein
VPAGRSWPVYGAVKARRAAISRIRALPITASAPLREQIPGTSAAGVVTAEFGG